MIFHGTRQSAHFFPYINYDQVTIVFATSDVETKMNTDLVRILSIAPLHCPFLSDLILLCTAVYVSRIYSRYLYNYTYCYFANLMYAKLLDFLKGFEPYPIFS